MQQKVTPERKSFFKSDCISMHAAPFKPLPGLHSPHLQTILTCVLPAGSPPPSTSKIIPLDDGDALCCEISTPSTWKSTDKTVIMLHGLGGSHAAPYMVRLSRKLYAKGYKAVRVNMRSCGSGKQFAKLPYHGGLSSDIHKVIKDLKTEAPMSPITTVGYSLGGNIALKLAAELSESHSNLIHSTIAICPPIDLAETAKIMAYPMNRLYNQYYMRHLDKLTREWTQGKPFSTIYEFDQLVTAPKWGFENPSAYYKASSSCFKLSKIQHPCHILLAADDPFINFRTCINSEKSSHVKVWLSKYGGHMGFFGWADKEHGCYWLDKFLLNWISEKA